MFNVPVSDTLYEALAKDIRSKSDLTQNRYGRVLSGIVTLTLYSYIVLFSSGAMKGDTDPESDSFRHCELSSKLT